MVETQHNIVVTWQQVGLDQNTAQMQNFAKTSETTAKSTDTLNQSLTETQKTTAGTTKEITKTGAEQKKTSTSTTSLGKAFKNSALEIASFASSMVSTYIAFDRVMDQTMKLDRMRAQLDSRTIALQKRESDLKTALNEGRITSEQYGVAMQKLDADKQVLAVREEQYTDAIGDQKAAMLSFAVSVIPTVITGISSVSKIIDSLKGVHEAATASTEGLTESTVDLGDAANVSTTTGIIPTIKSIGQMIPGVNSLRKVLGGRKEAGTAVGSLDDFGFAAADTDKSSNILIKSFKNMGSSIKTFFTTMKADIGSATGIIDKIGVGFRSFFGQIATGFVSLGGHLKDAGSAFLDFGKKLVSVFMNNPILFIIGAISTAIAALVFDLGGFRTKLNEIGLAIGNAVPALKPLLDGLGWLGEQLGLLGDQMTGTSRDMDLIAASANRLALAADVDVVALQKVIDVGSDLRQLDYIVGLFDDVRGATSKFTNELSKDHVVWIGNLDDFETKFSELEKTFKSKTPEVINAIAGVKNILTELKKGGIDAHDGAIMLNQALDLLSVELLNAKNEAIPLAQAHIDLTKQIEMAEKGISAEEEAIKSAIKQHQAAEDTYTQFAMAVAENNYDLIKSWQLGDDELDAFIERFISEYPKGAKIYYENGQKMIASTEDVVEKITKQVDEIGKVYQTTFKLIEDVVPPTMAQVEKAMSDAALEEQYLEDVTKLVTDGIVKDKDRLKSAIVALGVKYQQIHKDEIDILKDVEKAEDDANKTKDKSNNKLDEQLQKIQNLSETRKNEIKATEEQTAAAQDLVKELGIEVKVVGMSGEGLLKLVDIHDDLANKTSIAADNVGVWWAELQKAQALEKEELTILEEFADTIGVQIPNAIMAKGIPAVKAYIESVIGIGEGAKKAREEVLKAFNDLHNKTQDALSGIISDKLGEDGDEIKKAIKGIEKTGVSIMNLDAQSVVIDIFLDDTDYNNKVKTLDEILAKEYDDISQLSLEQGKNVGDKFIQSAIDALPKGAKGIGNNMEAIWNEIKASSSPTDTGTTIIGKLKAALERKDLILAAMNQGVKDPVARVMALTDQEAANLAKNIPTNLAAKLTAGKGEVDSAAKTGLKDPVTQNVELIPNEAETGLQPVEGVFSNAFLNASVAATGQLNMLFADIYKSMGFMISNTADQLTQILSLWNDHVTKVGTAIENLTLKLQLLQKIYETLTLAVKSNMTSMTTYTENFSDDSTTALDAVDKGLRLTQTNVSSTYTVWDAAMDEMSKKVGTFASACETAFGKVKKSADTATGAVAALQKAIDALKDKTVTITYKIETKGTPPKNARFGGSSIGYARGGDSWIQNNPGRIGNMNVSEFGKPEMVTVTPLSNPYDVKDKSINLGGGGGGGRPIIVTGNLSMIVQTQSGETLAKEVKPFLLSGFSGIT